MRIKLITLILFLTSISVFSQKQILSPPISPDSIPKGYLNFIYKNIRLSIDDFITYASVRPKYKIICCSDGRIICIPIEYNNREKNKYTIMDVEIMRIFAESPKWIPAKNKDGNITVEDIIVIVIPYLRDPIRENQ